jgi:acyl-CoA synthetase (AMP-forming)/AMP-acid ligase II
MPCSASGTHLELQCRYYITAILLVPSLVHQFVHHPRFKTADMSSVTMIGSGAAYLPPQLADQICARFKDVPRVSEGASSAYRVLTPITTANLHRLRPVRIRK